MGKVQYKSIESKPLTTALWFIRGTPEGTLNDPPGPSVRVGFFVYSHIDPFAEFGPTTCAVNPFCFVLIIQYNNPIQASMSVFLTRPQGIVHSGWCNSTFVVLEPDESES